ncbi:transcriptional regulator Myc-A isoform X2 [Chelonus insularis]|uniref:transcriptional regulator Myc-A isoform X2 n=1 Tax=Chelonus insularis TaxID=460826 RepID=UPI00158B2642|nr:transcriptional regulator Myc-A isoform X2 [Chelonus insularis]
MPVPTWDSSHFSLLDEPLGTVVSDDIWKKFDLDAPLSIDVHYHERAFDDFFTDNKKNCLDYPEIRHHDCMWAGLCISKEHNKTLPTKKDKSQIHRKVAAGRSLLISRAVSSPQQQHQQLQHPRRTDSLESDGDSTRPETPQSCSESDSDSEREPPIFKHEQISINEKLSECMSVIKAVHVSEVTGQFVRSGQRKLEANTNSFANEYGSLSNRSNVSPAKQTEIRNPLNDHSYHIHQPNNKRMDFLGVQTPSDSEEIDVVSFEKPCKPAILPTLPSSADHKVIQSKVNIVLNEKPAPRPRGRPPNASRKRPAQSQAQQRPAKRVAVQRTCAKKAKTSKQNSPASISIPPPPPPLPIKNLSSSRSSSDDEPDTDKRNLHNNMERQRRIELRNAFDDLRRLVPEIESKEKAPKVAILRQASKYCDKMKEIEAENTMRIIELKKQQEKLRARLSFLRRSLALTR